MLHKGTNAWDWCYIRGLMQMVLVLPRAVHSYPVGRGGPGHGVWNHHAFCSGQQEHAHRAGRRPHAGKIGDWRTSHLNGQVSTRVVNLSWYPHSITIIISAIRFDSLIIIWSCIWCITMHHFYLTKSRQWQSSNNLKYFKLEHFLSMTNFTWNIHFQIINVNRNVVRRPFSHLYNFMALF